MMSRSLFCTARICHPHADGSNNSPLERGGFDPTKEDRSRGVSSAANHARNSHPTHNPLDPPLLRGNGVRHLRESTSHFHEFTSHSGERTRHSRGGGNPALPADGPSNSPLERGGLDPTKEDRSRGVSGLCDHNCDANSAHNPLDLTLLSGKGVRHSGGCRNPASFLRIEGYA